MFKGKEEFKNEYVRSLIEAYGKPLEECSAYQKYENLVQLVLETAASRRTEEPAEKKHVYYFSMEFLIGRLLENYLINLGIREEVAQGLQELGEDLDTLCRMETDPGLGNGGLGRLAACFMDSMATLGINGTGMGIRYRFGLFRQRIENGYQIEEPDAWLENGYPWEHMRPDETVSVCFGGQVDRQYRDGRLYFEQKDCERINAVPYDVPVVGYGGKTVNILRLWQAAPEHDRVDMKAFNRGNYSEAMKERNEIEAITCILYPDDSMGAGRLLRLKQEYFFVAAGIASIVRQYKAEYGTDWKNFSRRVAIHTNDTHPTLCVPELMRILLDEEHLEWDEAWAVTVESISFTNHTVLPEALEKWPIELFRSLLPRIYMIVEEINRRYRDSLVGRTENFQTVWQNTAVLWDGEVRMANMSIIGGHSVNGVAALHTDILKTSVFRDFHTLMPEKFNNKTNGVSHRRFMVQANPRLASLITEAIGPGWVEQIDRLQELERFAGDSAFLEQLRGVKRSNKERLARYIYETTRIAVNPDSVFDIQVKRVHAYKRQLLNALKVLDLYNTLKENPDLPIQPYTFIFSGKAAQGYALAKEIIKFINSVADTVNSDPVVSQKIKVVFMENFCVSTAQLIYPAADISEQISTAGKEASGTGNMKFMLNGAITLGTLDGANVEIHDFVGDENMMLFGLTAEQVMDYYCRGGYSAREECEKDPRLSRMTSQLVDGFFRNSGCDFWGIYDALLQHNDEYFVLKDFASYMDAWRRLDGIYSDKDRWSAMSLRNIARSSFFSSDRTIREYAGEIWQTPCDIR